jgi:hypothetical protein
MTFVEDVLAGRSSIDDIDSYRETWDASDDGAGEYHEFLGLLWPEYAMYVEEDDVLECVIEARRVGKNVREYLKDRRSDDVKMIELWRLVERYDQAWEAIRPDA